MNFVRNKVNFLRVIRSRLFTGHIGVVCTKNYTADVRQTDDNQLYDVVISGGGMVGAAMATALGSDAAFDGKRILLLEAAPYKRMEKLPDIHRSRTCALSAASVQLMENIGAWNIIRNMRVQPVKHMQVWDCCSDSMISFHEDLTTDQPLAYIAENDIILAGITSRFESLNKDLVQVKYNARVKDYQLPDSAAVSAGNIDDQWAHVTLEDGQTLHTRLLIGADGVKSLVRQSAKIHTVGWEYWQTAVVATLTLAENGENTTAWQRFLPDGPIALLPLSNKHSCLIWSTSHSHAKQLKQMSAESIVDSVNHAFSSDEWKDSMAQSAGRLLGSVTSTLGLGAQSRLDLQPRLPPKVIDVAVETVGMFPLGLGHATHYVKPRLALIGDAAHRVHPLAGQGVNLGFGDVSSLHRHLVNASLIGADLGQLDHLLDYETERQRIVVPMMASCDGLNRIYSNRNPALILLRSIGCQTLQSLSPIKNLMMKFAMN